MTEQATRDPGGMGGDQAGHRRLAAEAAEDVLVGRGDEIDVMRGLVTRVAAGNGGAAWIDGEPGIGKSALLAASLADARRHGCQVFSAQAAEFAQRFPLRVLLDAFGIGPDAADPERAEIAALLWAVDSAIALTPQDAVAAASERLLILVDRLCAVGPVVLAVDDLQWTDESSLAVVSRLHRMVPQLPLLLMTACRPVPARAEVDRLRRGLDTRAVRLLLGGLSDSAVAELVTRLVGAPPGPRLRVQAGQAGGNPLYVGELVGALTRERRVRTEMGLAELVGGGPAPASLASAIADRLGFLSESTTAVLRMAALLGQEFSVDHLCVLTERPATGLVEAVDEAVSAGVVTASGDVLAFRHGLIRQALYGATQSSLRFALHRQAARALAVAGAPVEQVAEQLIAVPHGADAWFIEWTADSAPALIRRAPDMAVDLLERVCEAAGADAARRDELESHLATGLFQLGRYADVERVAGPPLDRVADPELAGHLAWTLGYALLRLTRYEQALAVTDPDRAEAALPAGWVARLRALRAMILASRGDMDRAERAAARAEAEARLADDRLALGYALHIRSVLEAQHRRDVAASLDTIDRALVVIGAEPQMTDLRLLLLGNRVTKLSNLGRLDEAARAIGEAVALGEQAGTRPRLAALRVQAAEHWFYTGRWDEALAELDAASDLALDLTRRLWMRGLAALIAAHRDDRAAVDRHLRADPELPSEAHEVRELAHHLLAAQGVAAERDGHARQALDRVLEAFGPATGRFTELPEDAWCWLPDVVRLGLAVGDRAIADAAVAASRAEAEHQALPVTLASAAHCRGLLAEDPGEVLSAADTFGAGYPLFRAQALENAAVLFGRRGELAAARRALTEAVRLYAGLDAAWDILRADTRLRPLGVRRGARGPRRRPTRGWDALTVTELRIAELVAAGNTNPDIASELFLSRATVNTHVSHILTKLDAHSRVDIAREVTVRRRPMAHPRSPYEDRPRTARGRG